MDDIALPEAIAMHSNAECKKKVAIRPELADKRFTLGIGTANSIKSRFDPAKTVLAANEVEQNITLSLEDLHRLFSQHLEGKKDGRYLLMGRVELRQGAEALHRANENMRDLCLAGLDLDEGTLYLDELKERLVEFGKVCFVYSTHSHMRDKDGTGPKPRFRLFFPLSEAFDPTTKEARSEWAERLRGLADGLGIPHDEACKDPARLMYFGRHAEGAPFETWAYLDGELLDLRCDVLRVSRAAKHRKTNPLSSFGSKTAGDQGEDIDPRLKRWAAQWARRFDPIAWLESHARDYLMEERPNGGHYIRCPHHEDHSTTPEESPTGCYAHEADPGDDEDGSFVWHCSHAHCQDRDRLNRIARVMELEGIDGSTLYDPEVLVLLQGDRDPDPNGWDAPFGPGRRTSDDTEADKFEVDVDNLPAGFSYDSDTKTIFFREPTDKRDDEGKPVFRNVSVCSAINLVGRTRDETSNGWSVVVEFADDTGTVHRHTVPMRDLEIDPKAVRGDLRDAGLWIGGSTQAKGYFVRLLSTGGGHRLFQTYTRPGWHDGSVFVTPAGEVISQDKQDSELARGARMKDSNPAGTLDGWREAIAAAVGTENPHWIIGSAAGFVGPILSLCGFDTAALNLSGVSSIGKSTAQKLAVSPWSTPTSKRGLLHSMSTTTNAIEVLAARSTGTVLALDELALADPRHIGHIVFSLASGASKSRMTVDGGLRRETVWNTFVLLSSERSLSELIKDGGNEMLAGQAVRCIDIDVSHGAIVVDGETLNRIDGIKENYGFAGPEFIRYLFDETDYVDDPASLRQRVLDAVTGIAGEDASPTAKRAALTLALINVAGNIAQDAGLLPWDLDLDDYIRQTWATFVSADASGVKDPVATGCNTFRAWVAKYIKRSIVTCGSPASDHRGVEGWYDVDEDRLYVLADTMHAACGKSARQSAVLKKLKEDGVLLPQGKNTVWNNHYIPKVGKHRHYRFKLSKLYDLESLRTGDDDEIKNLGDTLRGRDS